MVGPNPSRIRERIAQAGSASMAIRAEEVLAALGSLGAGSRITRGGLEIVFQRPPELIRNQAGEVVGVDALVRVFVGGVEQQMDPHRVCINPPTLVPSGMRVRTTPYGKPITVSGWREDPFEAYLSWLTDSLQSTPHPAGWRP